MAYTESTIIRDSGGTEADVTASNALKVDGSAVTQPVSAASLPLPTGAATAALQTQPGVDIGDVTVNNAAGASAVNIQDGGNSITIDDGGGSITVDGTVAVTGAGDATAAKQDAQTALLTTIDGDTSNLDVALSTRLKPADTLAGVTTVGSITNVVHVDDNAGSLTVDGTITANAGTNLNTSALALETTLQSVKTAVEIIDNFISGARGLVTEDNSAAIKTAVELIDNAVSGAGFNITQVGGTNIDTNSGNKSAGTQRVVIATDQPNLTTPLNVLETAPTTIYNGKTTVTTAGTRVVLAASTTVKSVTIKALAANTGTIYVGDSSVASTNGFQLAAGDTVSLDLNNLNTVNIDSSVNGEGVTYIANN